MTTDVALCVVAISNSTSPFTRTLSYLFPNIRGKKNACDTFIVIPVRVTAVNDYVTNSSVTRFILRDYWTVRTWNERKRGNAASSLEEHGIDIIRAVN